MKQYLGDGVYVDNDGAQIILTTENGIDVTNTIYMDSIVVNAFIAYIRKLTGE